MLKKTKKQNSQDSQYFLLDMPLDIAVEIIFQ